MKSSISVKAATTAALFNGVSVLLLGIVMLSGTALAAPSASSPASSAASPDAAIATAAEKSSPTLLMSAAISPAETEISTSTALAAPPPANSSAAPTAAKPSPLDRFELAVTFTAAYANQASGISNFWLNGGSAEVAGNLYRHLSIAGNFTGLHSGSAGQAGASGANNNLPLSLLTYTVGPRLTYVVPQTDSSHTVTIFTEFLAGEAHGFNSLFPALPTVTTSANSLALQLNVAGQVTLTPHLTFRVIQAGWLRTQLPNTLNNAQNNLQISSGVVLHF